MKLTSPIISLVALSSFAAGNLITAYHNTIYDNPQNKVDPSFCQLPTQYKIWGDLPTTRIGGYPGAACGSCWQIGYNHHLTYVLSVYTSDNGFQVSQSVFTDLGVQGGQGSIWAMVTQADKSKCLL